MKYYRMQVVQASSSVVKRCDRLGIGRQRECHARGSACPSLKLPINALGYSRKLLAR